MANASENFSDPPPVSTPDVAPAGLRRIAPQSKPSARLKARHGRSVRVLKVALPLVVLATVGSVSYWWLESRGTMIDPTALQQMPGTGTSNAQVTVQDVKYDGKDDKGRPFTITAAAASHKDGDDRHIALKKPMADLVLNSGSYVALTAKDGLLDRNTDIITLDGDVTLFHDNGLSFQTSSATIHLKDKTAEGDQPVEGQNGKGELTSEGF